MSPSVAVQLRPDQPVAPIVAVGANNNAQRKTRKPRRRAVKNPLPPGEARNLSQKIQAADEHWQEVVEAYNKRLADDSKANDLLMVAAFSCFVHSFFDDRDLCGKILIDFVNRLGKEKSKANIFS